MFEQYYDKIKELESFDKKDILKKDFELYKQRIMKIYYAPHNEIVNDKAKVFIVGITPGWTQTQIAYKTAHEGILSNLSLEEIKIKCKRNSRFAGSMRNNVIKMLDEIQLNKKLNINSCEELFSIKDDLLHTTSLIPYPVFINEKNYTGSNPKILENDVLYSYVKKYFYKEIELLPNALIVPLGKTVEEVLRRMISEGIIRSNQCLFGFPHPSGANGHRVKQFEANKENLKNIIDKYFEYMPLKQMES